MRLLSYSQSSQSPRLIPDIDGNPIFNEENYYIIPVTTTTSTSGLTYTQKEEECPLYITKETTENSPGTAVSILSKARTSFISLDESVSLTFQGSSTPCHHLLAWDLTLDQFGHVYITAGHDQFSMDNYLFTITKKDNFETSIYELKYGTGDSPILGLYEDDGLLGFAPNPILVSFKKAGYFLELPTTSKIQ
ncbi:hypothetical protein RND81_01G140800 [Saponaria officinalis]|uniref:Uncharacterized protein n=1 Tax=Saponaria officinalis TaxID=3572 RepID=A0AAW1NEM3_SAPOF